jgi:hypothetical protein
VKNVHAMRLSCGGAVGVAVATKLQKGVCFVSVIIRGVLLEGRVSNLIVLFARYGDAAQKKAAIIEDEADGNSQPLREFPIMQPYRGCGGDCFRCAACCRL